MDKIEDLAQKKQKCYLGGGEANIQTQHNLNKMTARERITCILDEGSFVEVGTLVGGNSAGVITGYGTVENRLVYVYSEDYTVDGGMITARNSKKIFNIMDMALKMGAPLVQIIDSTGAKLTDGLEILSGLSRIIGMNAKLSGVVPQIAIVAGPCTGISAISASMSDFTIIAENCGEFYINPSSKIQEAEGRYIDGKMYADAGKSSSNGSIQIVAADDREALMISRKLLQYLPSNNIDLTPIAADGEISASEYAAVDKVTGSDEYDVWDSINSVVDRDSIIEIDRDFGTEVITALAKINGLTVGVVANNKNISGGLLNTNSCEKVSRFVKVCDSFNISIVTMVDCRGFAADIEAEKSGLALAGAKMVYALAEANVPKVALITGEAYGAGYVTLASKESAFDTVYAWPNAKRALTIPEDAVKILYKDKISQSEKPELTQEELTKEFEEDTASSFRAAEDGYVDDIISPSETMVKLYSTLDMLQSKRLVKYSKKHGSALI